MAKAGDDGWVITSTTISTTGHGGDAVLSYNWHLNVSHLSNLFPSTSLSKVHPIIKNQEKTNSNRFTYITKSIE